MSSDLTAEIDCFCIWTSFWMFWMWFICTNQYFLYWSKWCCAWCDRWREFIHLCNSLLFHWAFLTYLSLLFFGQQLFCVGSLSLLFSICFQQQLGFFFKKALKTHCALCLYQTAGTNSESVNIFSSERASFPEDLVETKTECVAWILDLNSSWWPQPWLKRLGEDCGQRRVSTFSFYLFEKSTIEYFLQWTI